MVTLVDKPGLCVRVSDAIAATHELCPDCGGAKIKYGYVGQSGDLYDYGWEQHWFTSYRCLTCAGRGLVKKMVETVT